jgi:cytochrome b561
MAVLAVTVLRLRAPVRHRPAPQSMSWMVISSKLVQAGLYLLLFAVPLTAIAGAWLEGHPLTLLAGLQVAPQIAESHDLGVTISELHTWLGDAILWLAGLHAVAALITFSRTAC